MDPKVEDYFRSTVKNSIEYRKKEKIIRPDMIHLLLEARKGRLKHDESLETKQENSFATVEESNIGQKITNKIEITDEVITAQALLFFLAGFETTSSVISFLAYELALNQDIQEKLKYEIFTSLKECNGKISYDKITKMKYLDMIVSETLRKYPVAFILTRNCENNYLISPKCKDESDFVVEKYTAIGIPVYAIHRDKKYYPDPEKFNPERFSDQNKANILPGSYLPFGVGPRNCIGSRFALLEIKALCVSLLSKFNIIPIEKTAIPLRLNKAISLGSKDGFWLGLEQEK